MPSLLPSFLLSSSFLSHPSIRLSPPSFFPPSHLRVQRPLPFIRTSIHIHTYRYICLSSSLPCYLSFLSSPPPPSLCLSPSPFPFLLPSLPSTLSSLFPPLPIPRGLPGPSFCTSSGSYSRLNVDFDLATMSSDDTDLDLSSDVVTAVLIAQEP